MEVRNLKILIADDEKDLRQLLNDQLTGAGYSVIQAEDGNKAFGLFLAEKPDMAILDIMMYFVRPAFCPSAEKEGSGKRHDKPRYR